MDIVTIDFETYYDKDFSLGKMTTESYIRSPQFEVIGVGIKVNNHPTDWYSGDNVGQFLRSLDYSDKAILCHNTAFDGAILSWLYGIKPKLWLDTLSMARPLHNVQVGGSLKALVAHYGLGAKGDEVINALGKRRADFTPEELDRYASYCVNDVDITYALFNKMKVGFPVSELLIIDQTLRMYTEPSIVIDTDVLEKHLVEVVHKKDNLVEAMGLDCTEEEAKATLMSNDKFAAYLKIYGVEPPTKISPRTGKTAWAFSKSDKGFTALLDHPNEMVSSAASARLGVKSTIEETRTRSLLGVAERGLLPIMLNYYGAHTGRFSGGDKMNLQNLPRGGALRKALSVPLGKILVACDSAQIEARVVAWLAEQNDLLQAFADGRDVYSEFASDVYGRKITKADKIERFVGKTCILGLGYGMGAEKFRNTLAIGQAGISVNVELSEAERIVRLYRQKNHKIVSLWSKCNNAVKQIITSKAGEIGRGVSYNAEGLTFPNKLVLRYPALRLGADGMEYINDARVYRKFLAGEPVGAQNWTRIYGGKITENLVQGLARIVVAEQMAEIGLLYKVVLQVHDEVVIMVDEDEADKAATVMEKIMSTPPKWALDLPVSCESGTGYNYGEAK
jgi:hypothetical protein